MTRETFLEFFLSESFSKIRVICYFLNVLKFLIVKNWNISLGDSFKFLEFSNRTCQIRQMMGVKFLFFFFFIINFQDFLFTHLNVQIFLHSYFNKC